MRMASLSKCFLHLLVVLTTALMLLACDSNSTSSTQPDPDTTDPTVSLTVSETLVLGELTLTLTATAADDVAVVTLSFYDGATLLETQTASPFTLAIDLAEADNGVRAYKAVAEDEAGNSGESAVHEVLVAINHSPVFINGGFDIDASGWDLHHFDEWSGWTFEAGNPSGCMRLNEYGTCEVDPGVSQIVDGLIPGLSYDIAGEYKPYVAWIGNQFAESFVVTIDSVVVASFARDPLGEAWAPFTTSFTATTSSHRVGFWAEYDCDDSSYELDEVVLTLGR